MPTLVSVNRNIQVMVSIYGCTSTDIHVNYAPSLDSLPSLMHSGVQSVQYPPHAGHVWYPMPAGYVPPVGVSDASVGALGPGPSTGRCGSRPVSVDAMPSI